MRKLFKKIINSMIKYKKSIFVLAGLVIVTGIVWVVLSISASNQETAMLSPATTVAITPEQIPGSGTPGQSSMASPDKTVNPTTTPSKTSSPSVTPSISPTKTPSATPKPTVVPTPTKTPSSTPKPTVVPTPTKTPSATPTPTVTPTHTPVPTPTPTATPEPTPAFSYSVSNDDGIAPAGYTIVFVRVTPSGSYHVTYSGATMTNKGGGLYTKTVKKLDDGNYRSKVSVTPN